MRREEKGEGERGGDGESEEKGMEHEKRVGRMRGDGEGMFKMEKNNEKVLRNVSRFPLTKPPPYPYIDPKTQGLRIGEEGRKWGVGKVGGREGLKNCHFLIHQPSPPLPSPAQRPLLPPSSVHLSRNSVRTRQRAMFCSVLKGRGGKLKQAIERSFHPVVSPPPPLI